MPSLDRLRLSAFPDPSLFWHDYATCGGEPVAKGLRANESRWQD